jgi:hypothetical protein
VVSVAVVASGTADDDDDDDPVALEAELVEVLLIVTLVVTV